MKSSVYKYDDPVTSIDSLYKEYRDSDINEGCEIPKVLEFIHFIKNGSIHGFKLQNVRETDKENPDIPNIDMNCKCGLCASCTY